MLEDSVSRIQGLRVATLWTYRAEPRGGEGGPPQGPARPPSQRKTGAPGMRASGLACRGGGPCVGQGRGGGLGRVGGVLACADCARTSPRVWAAFRCEPLLLPRRGPGDR